MTCLSPGEMVSDELGHLATQYREAQHLRAYLTVLLGQVEDLAIQACHLPEKFDLDTAVGDQLTILGKYLGYPRLHCKGILKPVFGFECAEGGCQSIYPIAGLCEPGSVWIGCSGPKFDDYVFDDDEEYRTYLRVRRYQFNGLYDWDSLLFCLRSLWGDTAYIVRAERDEVLLASGRTLSNHEKSLLPLTVAVLPIIPTATVRVHIDPVMPFGFGEGWGGICDGMWINAQEVPAA
jgi:hypothetical protein